MRAVKGTLLFLITLYQKCIGPIIGPSCRFYPSCSHYATQALVTQPVHKALWLITKRLLKCSSWSRGGVDFVPEQKGPKK